MDWTREWAGLHLNKTPPRSRATAARTARGRGTWDIPVPGPLFRPARRRGSPSCGSRERGRSLGKPKAASRPLCPSCACWGRRGCWSPRGTGVERRSAPVGAPPGVWRWECGRAPQPYATKGSLHRGRSEIRLLTLASRFLPKEREKERL